MGYDVFISYNTSDQPVAEEVCRSLEKRGLRCFIAPRDITQSDWAGNLDYAIEHSTAFVIVVSEHSIASREVAKEIALATRVSDYIFPFRVDEAELNGRMNYHLSAFHWISAITPPMEKKINELADRVASALRDQADNREQGNRNMGMQRLLGENIAPRAEFMGRDDLLRELDRLLTCETNAVFLTGMGGIGKSEIAKAYADRHSDRYHTAVFATFKTDLVHLIADDQAVPVSNLQQAAASGGQGETAEAYYERKMKVLRSVVNEDILLIIDNFDVEYDDHLQEVLSLPCKQIWTTRTDFSAYGLTTLKVGPISDMEDLVRLMARLDKHYAAPEDQQAVRDIIELLGRHTLAISLTAAQMRVGWIKPRIMLDRLRTNGLHIRAGNLGRDPGQKRSTIYDYIRALFDFSRLDETACGILRWLACMPLEGVEIELFMECCDLEDFSDVSRLAELNWVRLDEENGRVGLHMLVKELVWDQLLPTEDNCETLLQGAFRWAKNAWNKPHEENRLHCGIIYSLLEAFPAPPIRWLEQFEEFATFAWIMGRFDLSERCEHHLYGLCVTHHGESSVQAGNQALRVAAVYHNQGDYAKARPWYEKGLAVQEAIDPESLDAWTARQKVARSNAQSGRYEEALKDFERNMTVIGGHLYRCTDTGDLLRRIRLYVSSTQKNLAQLYSCLGRAEEALPMALAAYEFSKTDTVEPSLIIYSLTTLVCVYQAMGAFETAVNHARQALEQTVRWHGRDRIDVVFLRETIGDLLARQGDFRGASEAYTEALVNREKLFPADTAALQRLEEKLDDAQRGEISAYPALIFWT